MFPKQEEPAESDTGLHSMAEFHRDIEKKFGVLLDRNRVLESRLREMEQDRETEAERIKVAMSTQRAHFEEEVSRATKCAADAELGRLLAEQETETMREELAKQTLREKIALGAAELETRKRLDFKKAIALAMVQQEEEDYATRTRDSLNTASSPEYRQRNRRPPSKYPRELTGR